MDWTGLGEKSYRPIAKFLQPFLFAQSFTGIPYCIGFLNMKKAHVSIHLLICDVVRQVHQDRSHFQSKLSVHRFQSACEASGSVQTLVLIILNYLSFFPKNLCVHLVLVFFCG